MRAWNRKKIKHKNIKAIKSFYDLHNYTNYYGNLKFKIVRNPDEDYIEVYEKGRCIYYFGYNNFKNELSLLQVLGVNICNNKFSRGLKYRKKRLINDFKDLDNLSSFYPNLSLKVKYEFERYFIYICCKDKIDCGFEAEELKYYTKLLRNLKFNL